MGRDAGASRRGRKQQHDQALVGGALEVGGKAGDVMAAAYGHRAAAVGFCFLGCEFHGAQHQPGAGQALAVPGDDGAMIGERDRFALQFHLSRFDMLQISG